MVLAYAVIRHGAVLRLDWNLCLLALGILILLRDLRAPRSEQIPPLNGGLRWAVILLPCYVAFQLVPLPGSVLRVLSPERAELLAALSPVLPEVRWAPLSVVPSATLSHFGRILGYVAVFLLVREIVWKTPARPWISVAPIIGVAGLEAALGLLQSAGGQHAEARGTYVNRNHLAGLLEMALPFAVLYAVVILRRSRSRDRSPARPALAACAVLSVAASIWLAILFSFSRMGLVAALCSLFFIASLALVPRLPARKKGLTLFLVACAAAAVFLFLPSQRMIARFAELATREGLLAEGRLLLWRESLQLVRAFPLFGCGAGGFESAFVKYKASAFAVRDDYAHNDYLQVLAELGIAGFAIAGSVIICASARSFRAALQRPQSETGYLAMACSAAILAILIHALVDFNLYIPANAMVLSWILGVSSALSLRQTWPARQSFQKR
jgi:O-antigen ligase